MRIIYYPKDSKQLINMKNIYSELQDMYDLKDNNFWYDEDEQRFVNKYKQSSDSSKVYKFFIKLENKIIESEGK